MTIDSPGSETTSPLMAKADVLVTGDQDLLELGDKAGIRIVNPHTLWEMLAKEKP